MTRLAALVVHDVRLQYRYGIYAAYAFVVAAYASLLISVGEAMPAWVAPAIIFIDPAAVGFIFLGALMLLERSEGVRRALAASPVRASDYLLGKVLTLTAVALAASAVLMTLTHRPAESPLLLLTVALTSAMYIGIGVLCARRFSTVNGYLIGAAALLTPLIAPGFLAFMAPFPVALVLWPSVAQQRLLLVALGAAPASVPEIALMLGVAALAAGLALWLALKDLQREFGK